jgi:predicted nucleotidyltransferase
MPLTTTPLGSLVEQHRHRILALVKEHKGRTVAVFGSVARGEDRPDSDIDFLVEFDRGASLFDLMRLEDDLRDLLGRRVDVVSAGGLLERDDDIRRDAVAL